MVHIVAFCVQGLHSCNCWLDNLRCGAMTIGGLQRTSERTIGNFITHLQPSREHKNHVGHHSHMQLASPRRKKPTPMLQTRSSTSRLPNTRTIAGKQNRIYIRYIRLVGFVCKYDWRVTPTHAVRGTANFAKSWSWLKVEESKLWLYQHRGSWLVVAQFIPLLSSLWGAMDIFKASNGQGWGKHCIKLTCSNQFFFQPIPN